MTLTVFVFVLMGSQLTGVGKATAAEAAAVRLNICVLKHVPLQVTSLCECFFTHCAFVGSGPLMSEQVSLKVAWLLEKLPAVQTLMRLNSIMTQDMSDKIIFRRVGLLTHTAFPAFQTLSYINTVRLINLYIYVQSVNLHSSGKPLWV